MAFRLPGYEPREYPEDDREKVNTMMTYLAENRGSPELMDTILEHLGWELDDIDQLALKELLADTGDVDVRPFGNLGKYQFKITDNAAVAIRKHGSYKVWKAVRQH